MYVDWKITGDGLLAFLGGAFALIAVLLSNRQSVSNLTKQLYAETKAHNEERQRRRRAVAVALCTEIKNILERCRKLRDAVPEGSRKPWIDFAAADVSIYRANAEFVGQFDEGTVSAVVGFYGLVGELQHHLDLIRPTFKAFDDSLASSGGHRNRHGLEDAFNTPEMAGGVEHMVEVVGRLLTSINEAAKKALSGLCGEVGIQDETQNGQEEGNLNAQAH